MCAGMQRSLIASSYLGFHLKAFKSQLGFLTKVQKVYVFNYHSLCTYINNQAKFDEARLILQTSLTLIIYDRNGGGLWN